MKLRGHKPGCRCVGCSPETRRRGMAALKRAKPKRVERAIKRAVKKGRMTTAQARAARVGYYSALKNPQLKARKRPDGAYDMYVGSQFKGVSMGLRGLVRTAKELNRGDIILGRAKRVNVRQPFKKSRMAWELPTGQKVFDSGGPGAVGLGDGSYLDLQSGSIYRHVSPRRAKPYIDFENPGRASARACPRCAKSGKASAMRKGGRYFACPACGLVLPAAKGGHRNPGRARKTRMPLSRLSDRALQAQRFMPYDGFETMASARYYAGQALSSGDAKEVRITDAGAGGQRLRFTVYYRGGVFGNPRRASRYTRRKATAFKSYPKRRKHRNPVMKCPKCGGPTLGPVGPTEGRRVAWTCAKGHIWKTTPHGNPTDPNREPDESDINAAFKGLDMARMPREEMLETFKLMSGKTTFAARAIVKALEKAAQLRGMVFYKSKPWGNPLTRGEAARLVKTAKRIGRPARKSRNKIARAYSSGYAHATAEAIGVAGVDGKSLRRSSILAHKVSRLANPRRLIGYDVTLWPSKTGNLNGLRVPESNLYAGSDFKSTILTANKFPASWVGRKIHRVDYDEKGKALSAYGMPGRFRHVCKVPLTVKSVTRRGRGYIVILASPVVTWRKQ